MVTTSSPRFGFAARSARSRPSRRADGAWTFKRVGFWRTHVTICAGGSEQPIRGLPQQHLECRRHAGVPDGRFLRANTNFWMTRYEFKTDSETPMVRFSRIGGALHLSSMVEIEPAAARLDELPWLVALGWYLAIKMHDDRRAPLPPRPRG
jgi:hypothetical protein